MAEKKDVQNSGNDGLALVVGGLFVLALVFATYSYFNRSAEPITDTSDTQGVSTTLDEESDEAEDKSLAERIKDLFNSQNEEGDVNGEAATTSSEEEMKEETDTEEKMDSSTDSPFAYWVANDYQEGDVTGNSYVVKSGDTLWEIAEAKYGNGADWTKILEANSSDIGYLAGGEHALITVGQTLVLP